MRFCITLVSRFAQNDYNSFLIRKWSSKTLVLKVACDMHPSKIWKTPSFISSSFINLDAQLGLCYMPFPEASLFLYYLLGPADPFYLKEIISFVLIGLCLNQKADFEGVQAFRGTWCLSCMSWLQRVWRTEDGRDSSVAQTLFSPVYLLRFWLVPAQAIWGTIFMCAWSTNDS